MNTNDASRNRSPVSDRIHTLARRWLRLAPRLEVAKAQWDATASRSRLHDIRADEWGEIDSRVDRIERELKALVLDAVGPAPQYVRRGNLIISVALDCHDLTTAETDGRVSIVRLGRRPARDPQPAPATT